MGIKSLELEPTKDNILQTIDRNLIDRNHSVWQFARFCDAQEGRCSIALDAQWGYGKTFFVKQAKMLLESFNAFTNTLTDGEKAQIKSAFSKYIGSGDNAIDLQPQVCVYYDSWSNDNDIDPVLSLIYEIVRDTACDYSFKQGRDCVKIAASIIDFFTGKDAKEFIELMRGDDPLSELKSQKDIHAIVESFLDSLLSEQGNRLVIFIDELDRCKPSYAVQLLERIKHYFSNDRITFDGDHHEYELLSAAYLSSLQVADALGCKSIAIPLLSSGNNGFKVPVSYELAIQTIEDYQPENKLEDVYLIVYGNQIVTMLRRQHVSISENINENYVLLKDEKYRTPVVEAALYLKDRGADFIKDNQRKLQNMLESEEGRKELFDNAVNIAKIVVPFVLNKFKEKQEDNSHNQKNN